MKQNTWFEETFLPSFLSKMNDPKYPNRALLSDKQLGVCASYMKAERYCYSYETDRIRATVWSKGRFNFITVRLLPYSRTERDYARITKCRWARQDALAGRSLEWFYD